MIYVFGEGATEEKIIQRLEGMTRVTLKYVSAGGKSGLMPKVVSTLGPLLAEPPEPPPILCLILRDHDSQEQHVRIVESVAFALRRMFQERGFEPSHVVLNPFPDQQHVFTLQTETPPLRLVLHIADFDWKDKFSFINTTIDDYVMSLALEEKVAHEFAQEIGMRGDKLVQKVTEEIPDLLRRNGMNTLQEAKDYILLYAAVARLHTSPPVFAEKTLAHADEASLQQTFSGLLAAVDFLRR